MHLILCMLLSGCITTKKQIEKARIDIGASECLIGLERLWRENHCNRLEIFHGEHAIAARCIKPNTSRKNIWDTWWFRITSSILRVHPEQLEQVEFHTICHDAQVRIEAYPPEEQK